MFLELVATIAAGIGAAGLVLVLNRVSGGRLPRWAMPVAAGLAMLGYAIWSEYTWAERTAGALPEGMVVLHQVDERIVWKPWTYIAPQTTRLMVLDVAAMRDNPAAGQVRLVDLYLFARWRPPGRVGQLVDCAAAARADATEAALADPATGAEWFAMSRDDPLFRRVCGA